MLTRLQLLFLVFLPLMHHGQGLNGGFEAVHAGGIPAGWSRILDNSSSLTSDAFSGAMAAKAWVSEYYKSGGWVSTSKPPSSAGLPSSLTGVYKYEGRKKECDPALVQVFATRRGAEGKLDTLARGETELFLSKKYRSFDLNLDVLSGAAKAEFLSVRILAEGRCDWHIGENCCFLFADDLAFDERYTNAIPAPDKDAIDREPNEQTVETEPVFIQPARKKRKKRSFILRPVKPRNAKKNKRAKAMKAAPAEEAPTPIPPEIQREIDRINAAQNDSTPDPAKLKEKEELPQPSPEMEEESVPEDEDYPLEPEDGDQGQREEMEEDKADR